MMMQRSRIIHLVLLGGLCGASVAFLRAEPQAIADLTPRSVTLAAVEYRGKRAVRMTEGSVPGGEACAVVNGVEFHNGTIDVELAGQPAEGAPATARGFIGVAFRMGNGKFEHIYLRPTNGRADDQVRRNHSTQVTRPFPTSTSPGSARKRRKSTRATWISRRARGPTIESSSRQSRRACSSTAPPSPRSWSMT